MARILTRVLKRELTMTEAAGLVGLSERQLWRLRSAFERDGPAGLVHGNRGRPSERQLDGSLRARVGPIRHLTYARPSRAPSAAAMRAPCPRPFSMKIPFAL